MCGIYGLCLLASCALVPLNLYMKNNPRQSLRSRIMNTENLSVFRTPLLYAMSGVFFFTGIGLGIPLDEVGRWYGFAPLIVLAAVLLAMIISCCCFRKLTRETSLAAITILGFFMGVWTLSVKGFDAQTYTCIYSLLYGMGYERGAVDVTQPPTTEAISLPRVSVHSV